MTEISTPPQQASQQEPQQIPQQIEKQIDSSLVLSSESAKKAMSGYLAVSITLAVIFAVILFLLTPSLTNFFLNPQGYFGLDVFLPNFTSTDLQLMILKISSYALIILIGYITYLLLTLSTRSEMLSEKKTRNLLSAKFQLEELYEDAPIPYLTINKEGEIHGCNKSALRFFGVVPEEISGKNFFLFTAQEDKDLGDKFLNLFKLDSPINRQEIRLITKTEGVKWASISIFLSRDPMTGKKSGLVAVFDITEQKELDQAKTEFVSLASHQLRTPLATIKWYTEMLNSNQLGELNVKQKEYLNRMYSVGGDMIDLVEVLLNVSRIEIGTLPIVRQKTNVPEIIDSILIELASQIDKKKIVFQKNYNDSLLNIDSDPKLLRIVIQNLITNAIKYNRDGGSVTINLIEGGSLGQSSITVSDTGLGIPKEDQDKIFSKLFRARNVKDVGSSQSTGLGLYLVKSVAEAMGGSISFTSEENVGSNFTLKL